MHLSYNNIIGILGTIAFHLLIVFFFLLSKVNSREYETFMEVRLDIDEFEILDKIMQQTENKEGEKLNGEESMKTFSDELRRNIAVNTAKKVAEEISTEKYIEQFKKESNIKDRDEMLKEIDAINPEEQPEKMTTKPQKQEHEEYKGKTTISYMLENRKHRNMPVPVYRCEGNGDVVVEVYVDRNGKVVESSILQLATNNNECLSETAIDYARRTSFNPDSKAPERQKGSITYHFIAQ